jgi:putative transposase
LHTIWTLPTDDYDYATRWRLIKSQFSRSVPKGEHVSQSRLGKNERGIWQRRYWEHTIQDELDYSRHMDYVHINPVKHGYVNTAVDWPYSSFHRYVEMKVYPANWTEVSDETGDFGEFLDGA